MHCNSLSKIYAGDDKYKTSFSGEVLEMNFTEVWMAAIWLFHCITFSSFQLIFVSPEMAHEPMALDRV